MPKDDCVLLSGHVKSAQKKHRIVFSGSAYKGSS